MTDSGGSWSSPSTEPDQLPTPIGPDPAAGPTDSFGRCGSAPRDAQVPSTGPSLSALIEQIATRDYGIAPTTAADPPKLPLHVIAALLTDAGLRVVTTDITGQHTTTAERAAWLSTPVFAHPEGTLAYEQKMAILAEATAQTKPDAVTVTSWLVIVAELPEDA